MFYLYLANGFEEVEALCTVDILRRAGIEIMTVGLGSVSVTGSHGITVTADISTSDPEYDINALDGVILPGGMPGTKNLDASPEVDLALRHAAEHGLWIAAICAAPMVLGRRGYLNGRRATCYPGFEDELSGAELSPLRAVCDGRIITANGPGSAVDFALTIVAEIKGSETRDRVAAGFLAK